MIMTMSYKTIKSHPEVLSALGPEGMAAASMISAF